MVLEVSDGTRPGNDDSTRAIVVGFVEERAKVTTDGVEEVMIIIVELDLVGVHWHRGGRACCHSR